MGWLGLVRGLDADEGAARLADALEELHPVLAEGFALVAALDAAPDAQLASELQGRIGAVLRRLHRAELLIAEFSTEPPVWTA